MLNSSVKRESNYRKASKSRKIIHLPQAMEHGVNCYGNKGPEYLSYHFITYYAGMELAETIIPGEKRHGFIKVPIGHCVFNREK